jgi:hypothetical protein
VVHNVTVIHVVVKERVSFLLHLKDIVSLLVQQDVESSEVVFLEVFESLA